MPPKPTETQSVVPYVLYENGPKALEFLCNAFGFEEQTRIPREDGSLMHAEVKHDGNVIMLGTPLDEKGKVKRLLLATDAPERSNIMCYVHDVKKHYAHTKSAGARIILELQERSHGAHMYAAADPEGHSWYFSTYQEG